MWGMVEKVRITRRLLLGLIAVFLLAGAVNAIIEGSPRRFLVVLGALFIVLAAFAIISLVQAAFLAPLIRRITGSGGSRRAARNASHPDPPRETPPEGRRR